MPRWARSAYDRGIEEIQDFLDLLWGFSFLDFPKFRFVKKETPFWRGDFLIFAEGCFCFWWLVVGCWEEVVVVVFFLGGGYVRHTCVWPSKHDGRRVW